MTVPGNNPTSSAARPTLSIVSPRALNATALLVLSAYGFLLLTPVLISLMVVSVLPFGSVTFILPLAIMAITLVFLPFGFGNTYVGWLVRKIAPDAEKSGNHFTVQITFTPRLREGLGAMVEDADDVGCLRVDDDALRYDGDSVRMVLPYSEIKEIRRENIGWRGLFMYGAKTTLLIPALDRSPTLRIGERQSVLLPGSRQIAKRLHNSIAAKLRKPPSVA